MGPIQKIRQLKRTHQIALGLLVTVILYTVFGFFILPPILKHVFERRLSESLHRQVTVQKISCNPYALSFTINNLLVKNRERVGHVAGFAQLFVDLEMVSLFKQALIIRSCSIEKPWAKVVRNNDLSYNFSDLFQRKENNSKAETEPFLFSINNIEISNGGLEFYDIPKDKLHTVTGVNLSLPFISNLSYDVEIFVQPSLAAVVNGTPFLLEGRAKPFVETRETEFAVQIKQFNIPEYLAYIPGKRNYTANSGLVDADATLSFVMQPGKQPAVSLAGDFFLHNIELADLEGESFFSLPELSISVVSSSLFQKTVHLGKVECLTPWLSLERTDQRTIMPFSLFKTESSQPPSSEAKEEGTAFDLEIDEMICKGGKVHLADSSLHLPFKTILDPVDIRVTGFSTARGRSADYILSFKSEADEQLELKGNFSVNPVAVAGNADLKSLRLPRYDPYFQEFLVPRLAGGDIDLHTRFQYAVKDSGTIARLFELFVDLSGFSLENRQEKTEMINAPSLSVRDTAIDFAGRQLKVGIFSTQDGKVRLKRTKEGLVTLKELFRPAESGSEVSNAPESSEKASRPWLMSLQKATMKQYTVQLEDHAPIKPAMLDFRDVEIMAEDFSTARNSLGKVSFAFRIDEKGGAAGKGSFGIDPLTATGEIGIKDVAIKTIQPYFADTVDVVISDGVFSADGRLEVASAAGEEISTRFLGNGSIAKLVSLDPVLGEKLITWEALDFNEVDINTASKALKVGKIAWQDFFIRLIVTGDGTLNFKSVIPERPTPDKEQIVSEKQRKSPLLVEIDTVSLQGGEIDFQDRQIRPNYAATLNDINGAVNGLSSQETARASANVTARLNRHAPLLITGRINPLRDNLYADVSVDFKDIELSPMSPYTGKYIGNKTEKGKLSLDLHYLVEENMVKAENRALLDQFTLGESVESKDAVHLPIRLAMALLKNRKGEITLNIPVSGNLNDPEFSVGGVIFKALVNLIAKAATSPFALLAAIIPEGKEMQYVGFEPGSSFISSDYEEKLKVLAKALFERPGLRMEITGKVEPDSDRLALQDLYFARLLKVEKLKQLMKKKEKVSPVDDIIIEQDEYEKYLKMAYKAGKFAKPKNLFGFDKRQPVAEMERMLLASVRITENDLRLLAIERAEKVKDFLVKNGPIEPERLFIIEPQVSAVLQEGVEGAERRADLSIK